VDDEQQLLQAAKDGDEGAFERLIKPRRGELHAHCYRMLGSTHDADDALQEVYLRAWRGLSRFEGRSSLRSWLYTIATNACLNAIERRPKRVLPIDYGPSADPHDSPGAPLVESVWVDPYPDGELGLEDGYAAPEARYEQRESVELAFVAALQHLPANQRATLILREVLGFSAAEVADSLDTTTASVNSALQRARQTVEERVPDQSQQPALRSLGDEGMRKLVEDYSDAIRSGDVTRVVTLLTEDATWSMPPLPGWYRGTEAVTGFLSNYPLRERWKHVPVRANGQLAIGCLMWNEERERYLPAAIDVLELSGDKIRSVTAFLAPWLFERFGEEAGVMTPEMYRRFGLPDELPA